jgi:four helix bundle protein
VNYQEWVKSVPVEITADPLWTVEAYRLALFASDMGWQDVSKLMRDRRTLALSDQLYRAIGSSGANISEGYSRGSNKDRARFYEYALGSARESRHWYYDGRHVLGETVTAHRLRLHTQVVRLLLTMIPDQRGQTLHEDSPPYGAPKFIDDFAPLPANELSDLLQNVPMP